MRLIKLFGISVLSVIAILFLLHMVGYEPMSDATNTAQATPEKITLAPEMIVKPVHGKFLAACLTQDLLTELIGHSIRHEKTKFEAMFYRMDCTMIPETETYKVLSVSNDMAEFVNVNARMITSSGMWAVAEAFAPAK